MNAAELLDEYEILTRLLPSQHEIKERGCCSYNWRMAIIGELRAMNKQHDAEREARADERIGDERNGRKESVPPAAPQPAMSKFREAAMEERIERAFWEFDTERKRTGAERDAFKHQLRHIIRAYVGAARAARVEPWHGHKFSEHPAGEWRCECGFKLYAHQPPAPATTAAPQTPAEPPVRWLCCNDEGLEIIAATSVYADCCARSGFTVTPLYASPHSAGPAADSVAPTLSGSGESSSPSVGSSVADLKDAERYRFLRARLLALDSQYGERRDNVLVFLWPDSARVSMNLDASIDAAMGSATEPRPLGTGR